MSVTVPGSRRVSADGPDAEVEHLARAAAGGSNDALGQLYERYADLCYRFIVVRVRDQAVAEDVGSELWMRVARSIGKYTTAGNGFPAWLLTIASRVVADYYRKPAVRRETPTADMLSLDAVVPGDGPEEVAVRSDTAAALARSIEQLSAGQRECVTLRFFVGLAVAETAALMQRTEGSVKVLQHRALRRLAKVLPAQGADTRFLRTVTSVRREARLRREVGR